MIKRKTFVTTSGFILTAVLLSQIYSSNNLRFQSQSINYSAFINLVENVKSVSTKAPEKLIASENTVITDDIIKVIDSEISKNISQTRYAIRSIKAPKIEVYKEADKVIATIEAPLIIESTSEGEENLGSYEINNSDLINLYALSVEEMAFIKLESIKLADSYNEVIKDEVVVAQASTKSAPIEADEISTNQQVTEASEIARKEDDRENEEMVMFDYSDKAAKAKAPHLIDQKLYERPLSETVQKAISREIENAPAKKLVAANSKSQYSKAAKQNIATIDNQEIDLNSEENTSYEYSQPKAKTTQAQAVAAMSESNNFAASSNLAESLFILKAKEIDLSTQKKRQAIGFEFVPDYDRAERSDDQTTGEIAFRYSLSGDMNTQTGVVQALGMISTRIELNLGGKESFEIPLINEDGMQTFLQKQGLSIEGNLVMLAVDPSIVDTEIDSKFARRFFFDKNFISLASESGASFVMYAGVKTGNIMIRYLLSNKESAQKIIYVGDGEMYYEDALFTNSNRETFTFTTRNLLGQKRKELIIDGGDISYFNTNNIAKKKALNAYDMKIPTSVSGMRRLLEFKHLKDSIFVGSSSEKEIEIPSSDFIGKVLEMNQVSSLKDRCVVQVNLSKDLRAILANGKNRSGEMFVETSFLDIDGNFSRDSLERADKVFVVGDLEGQFNIKLDYNDGSTEFLKTFCSQGTYLVEQL